MFSKRMMAVAAMIALAVPAVGAAVPVVVGVPTPETLVEGHTVFTIIESNITISNNASARFAAAVAVLVREYEAENRDVRFPGVLWFNDQYLVNPQSAKAEAADYRYPCGGAVLAVNRGDPDPRLLIASVNGAYSDPVTDLTNDNTLDGDGYNTTAGAWLEVNTGSPSVQMTNGPNASADYVESYYITDPNDHTWIVDLHKGYTRSSTLNVGGTGRASQTFFIWSVNLLGGPAFIPDDGALDCQPLYDQAAYSTLTGVYNAQFPCGNRPNPGPNNSLTMGPTVYGVPGIGPPNYEDNPCAGYREPSASPSPGPYCYGGQTQPAGGCTASGARNPAAPLRLYNALLYFQLQHLTSAGAAKNHSTGNADTNGCHAGTEWSCPASGGVQDDNMEGNSHPFHPANAVGGHNQTANDGYPCYPQQYGPATVATNHGGNLTGATPNANGGYGPIPCSAEHATRNIDIYFSPLGRPYTPLFRNWVVSDTVGSEAPFHDTYAFYGTAHP